MLQAYVQYKIKYKKPMAQPIVLKINISRMQRSLPAPFLSKTYQLVDDSSTDDIISWNECGSTFVIWRPPEFSSDLLPNYFKHNNFSSFVRQLNTYGFKKTVTDRWEFANDFFKKGEKHLLIDIHRRKAVHLVSISPLPVKRPLSPSSPEEEQALSSGSSSDRGASPILSDETERLKTENMLLAAEVSCLRRLCMDLVLHIQRHTSLFGDNLAHVSRLFSHLHSHIITIDDKVSDQNPAREMRQVSDEHKAFMKEQSGSLLAICGASDGSQQNDPPKLFGVPLPCKGRRFSESSLDHGHL